MQGVERRGLVGISIPAWALAAPPTVFSRCALLVAGSGIMALLAAVLALHHALEGGDGAPSAVAGVVAFAGALGNLWLIRFGRGYRLALLLLPLELLVLFTCVAWWTGGPVSSALPWVVALPLLATFLGGPSHGAVVAGLACVALAVLTVLGAAGYSFPPQEAAPDRDLSIRMVLLLLAVALVALISHVYDRLHERSRREREREADRFRHVFDGAGVGMALVDRQAHIVLANPALETLLGFGAGGLAGRSMDELNHPDEAETHAAWLQRLSAGPAPRWQTERSYVRCDGRRVIARLDLSALPSQADPRGVAIAMLEDITEQRRAQEERERLELRFRQSHTRGAIGRLAGGIAHEINTPMQYIIDNTRFLEDAFGDIDRFTTACERLLQSPDDAARDEAVQALSAADLGYLREEVPQAISQALEGADRVTAIVRAMKEFASEGASERGPVDIHHAIETTLTLCRNVWKYVADVETDFDPSMPLVPCCPGELNQVVLSLMVNAGQAIADAARGNDGSRGLIRVQTRRDGAFAVIHVRDTGVGIPPELRSRVFQPFFTTRDVGQGSGQSLAVAHASIVHKHRGDLSFESEVGVGTTFTVRLPLDPSPGQEPALAG